MDLGDLKITDSPERMVGVMGQSLATATAQKAFEFFSDKKFRNFLGWENLSQLERDRIFNELVVSGLVMLMLLCESPDLRMEEGIKDYLRSVKDKIGREYVEILKENGVERKYLNDWEKLVQMRYNEYAKDKHEVRSAAMEVEAAEDGLDLKKLEGIQMLLPVHTVAIGCHHHICRGKTEGKDELFKLILKWLGNFYVEIRVTMEGGKITWWKRLKSKLRHIYNTT